MNENLSHFLIHLFLAVFFGVASAMVTAVIIEIVDEINMRTKPGCHTEGFNLKDLFFRLLPVGLVFAVLVLVLKWLLMFALFFPAWVILL